jgi:hypothetical protein
VFVQITLFNDAVYENQQSIYIKWQQAKIEWGISRSQEERDRESRLEE